MIQLLIIGRPAHEWVYDDEEIGTYADEADYTFVAAKVDTVKLALKDNDEDLYDEFYEANAKKVGLNNVTTVIEYGSPKQIIAKEIPEDNHVDLIMLGATGLNAVERLFIGSVSEYVIRNATCDVLVVRTDLENKLPEKE